MAPPNMQRRRPLMASENFGKELKSLGSEMASAFKQMKESREFKQLESDLSKSIKSISSSLGKALKAAQKSPSTKKIKNRFTRVVKAGTKEGKTHVKKAESMAVQKIKEAREALEKMASQIKNAKSAPK